MIRSMTYKEEIVKLLPTQNSLENFADSTLGNRLVHSFDRTLIWLQLLKNTYPNNSTNILLVSIHSKLIEFWALVPLRLTHAASGSLRTITDLIFSYSYYINHPKDWEAFFTGRNDWEGRAGILEWHIKVTQHFLEYNKQFGVLLSLDTLNRDLSYFVHGIPSSGLPMIYSLNREDLDKTDIAPVIVLAERVDTIINSFLIGVFFTFLPILSSTEYKFILSGIDKKKLAASGIYLPSK